MAKTAVPFFFVRTKLHRPSLPDDHVVRHRLLAELQAITHYPLTLITAPAGYGKTTLLSSWIEQSDYPVAWLSLDDGDSQLAVFVAYFVAAIQSIFPDFGREQLTFDEAAAVPPLRVLSQLLVNAIDELPQSFVLVLDDYHEIVAPEINQLLDNLLQYAPRPLHLVLLTRHEPALQLPRLRARQKVIEIWARELRFSWEEVALFTGKNLPTVLDDETISILTEKTEGWPVGLRLATIAIRQWGIADQHPVILQVENQYVIDYLVNEVLARQSTAVRDFLLKTSLVERFCAPLCAVLIEDESGGATLLRQIEQDGLFVESLVGQPQWYRYHQLFRLILRQRLQEMYAADEIAALHMRASGWLAAHGFVEEALDHALQGGAISAAIDILMTYSHRLMNEERWLLLDSYLHKFPESLVQAEPNLLVLWGWLHVVRWRLDRVETVRQSLIAHLERDDLPPADLHFLKSSCQVFRAIRDNWSGLFHNAVLYAQEALAIAAPEWRLLRSYAWVYLGTALSFMHGEQTAVQSLANDAIGDREDAVPVRIRRQATLAIIYWQSANLTMLRQECELGIHLSQSHHGVASTSVVFLHLYLGHVYYQRNDLAAAAEQFAVVVERPYGAHPYAFVLSAMGLALVHQVQGRENEAWQVVETAVHFCLEREFPRLLAVVRAFQMEMAWRQGHLEQASHLLEQVDSTQLPKVIPFTYDVRLTLCHILLAQETTAGYRRAEVELTRLLEVVTSTHNIRFQMETLALQALLYQAQNKMQAAQAALQSAVHLAEAEGFVRLFVDMGPKMARLLKRVYGVGERPIFIQQVLDAFPATAVKPIIKRQSLVEPLTEREMEVLALLAQRFSNKEIGQHLSIAPETVKRHTINIYQKLSVQSRRQAVAQAYTLGLLENIS